MCSCQAIQTLSVFQEFIIIIINARQDNFRSHYSLLFNVIDKDIGRIPKTFRKYVYSARIHVSTFFVFRTNHNSYVPLSVSWYAHIHISLLILNIERKEAGHFVCSVPPTILHSPICVRENIIFLQHNFSYFYWWEEEGV